MICLSMPKAKRFAIANYVDLQKADKHGNPKENR
jgi:hypothetical protein